MSSSLKFVVFLVIVMVASAAFGQPTIVNFDFGAVRIACSSDYSYQWPVANCQNWYQMQNFNSSPGFGWTLSQTLAVFVGLSGLTGPNTVFAPPSFNGLPFNQAVYLQGAGSFVWQEVGGFTAGNYTLSFYLGSRYTSGRYDGNQTVVALIDGNVVGSWALSSFTPFTLQTASFSVNTNGSHTLEFIGTNLGDHTAFLSYVVITPD